MMDRTSRMEAAAKGCGKPSIKHLVALWIFVFSSTKKISGIYLGLFVFLSVMRPLLAFIWMKYITVVERASSVRTAIALALLLISYWALGVLADLIDSFMAVEGDGDMEQLDAVQANRQQELMHAKIYKKISKIFFEYFELSQLHDEMQQVFEFVGNASSGVNREVMLKSYIVIAKTVSLASIALSLFFFNPWLCLILLIMPLPIIWTSTIGEILRFKFKKDNAQLKRRTDYYQGLMLSSSSKEIAAMGLYDHFFGRWKESADEYTQNEKASIRSRVMLDMLNSTVTNAVNVGGMVFTIVMMAANQISLGAFAAATSLIGTLVNDTTLLLSSIASLLGKKQEAKQFFDFMAIPEAKDEGTPMESMRAIEAKGLKYRYPMTGQYILNGIDFAISKGERVAFVGENGEGKTTLVKLIMGFMLPSDGELMVNGVCVEDLNPIDRYRSESAVMQAPSRYQTFTVRQNVYMGDASKACDEAAVDAALHFAGLSGLDLDAVLGREVGGVDLSGGEWQKLAIARSAYRNRDFMILDEPTSNLDPQAETEIFQKYMELAQGRTVLFVTHRISMAALADRILVFQNGKIAQNGSHDELMKQGGKYARLYNMQAQWYDR